MTQHVQAIYEHGVLKPLAPLDLREHEVVSLSIVASATASRQSGGDNGHTADVSATTLFDVLNGAGLVGCVKDAPGDLSTNPAYLAGLGRSGQ